MEKVKLLNIVGATKSLREFLESKIPNLNTNEGKLPITYIDGYLKIKSFEEKLNNHVLGVRNSKDKEFDSKIPFILLRAGKWKQTINNGDAKRILQVSIRLVTKNSEENGYQEITELADEIINLFNMYPSLKGGYALDTEEISGGIQDELSTGDYWTYVIELNVTLPVAKPRLLKELGWI